MIIIPTSEHYSLSRSTYITFRCLLQNNYINLNKKQCLQILELSVYSVLLLSLITFSAFAFLGFFLRPV